MYAAGSGRVGLRLMSVMSFTATPYSMFPSS